MAEILAPAGSLETVLAAIDAGANAVYVGGKLFNARKFAHNLDDEELAKAVKTAHLFGVRIYVTVNILVADVELVELTQYLKKLDELSVDGIIVQDLAVAAIAHQIVPNLPLHGSTQQTVADIQGVRFLEQLGFTQVVLSRELSLKEIKDICAEAKAAIEVFVHGAECVCYSGQCLMSSFIGGRSGNRGACAQPCRLAYTLMEGQQSVSPADTYVLSLKDLNSLSCVEELLEAGVSSFKIEGRMKGSGYVRSVVEAYRLVADAHTASPQERLRARKEAEAIVVESFNRGYQSDFLKDTVGRQTITETAPGNRGHQVGSVTSTRDTIAEAFLTDMLEPGDMVRLVDKSGQECLDELQSVTAAGKIKGKQQYLLEFRRSDIFAGSLFRLSRKGDRRGEDKGLMKKLPLYFHLSTDDASLLKLTVWDEAGHVAEEVSSYTVQKATKRPATLEWVRHQLDRLGDTVFSVADVTLWDETCMIPSSVLNDLRRQAVGTIETAMLAAYERPRSATWEQPQRGHSDNQLKQDTHSMRLTVRCDSLEGAAAAVEAGADRIIYGGESYQHQTFSAGEWKQVVQLAHRGKCEVWAASPRILRQRNTEVVRNELIAADRAGVDGVYVGALGVLTLLQQEGIHKPFYADWSLNIFNSKAARLYADCGCSGLTLSQELMLRQIQDIVKASVVPIEVLAAGRLEMMVMENCPISSFAGSGKKKNCAGACRHKAFFLKDRRDEAFPLVTDQFCRNHILNSRDLDMAPYFRDLAAAGIGAIRIEARGRQPQWIQAKTKQYRRLCDGSDHMLLGKEDRTVTRGHYFHGIM